LVYSFLVRNLWSWAIAKQLDNRAYPLSSLDKGSVAGHNNKQWLLKIWEFLPSVDHQHGILSHCFLSYSSVGWDWKALKEESNFPISSNHSQLFHRSKSPIALYAGASFYTPSREFSNLQWYRMSQENWHYSILQERLAQTWTSLPEPSSKSHSQSLCWTFPSALYSCAVF